MSPEMLMQPFEQQSFTVVPPQLNNYYQQQYHHHFNTNNRFFMEEQPEEPTYMLGYPTTHHPMMMHQQDSGDFRPTFYNPFEIKHRRRTSRAQLKILERSFLENAKPNATVRRILAQKLDMTPRGVQIWFQNRRAKAKLLRRKSSGSSSSATDSGDQDQQDKEQQDQSQQQQQDASPIPFSQFFKNLKAWDNTNNATSIANVAAASCMFDASNNNTITTTIPSSACAVEVTSNAAAAVKIEEWFKLPIHPLAPVIDSSDEFDFSSSSPIMSSDEWRRKSCPALGSSRMSSPSQQQDPYYHFDTNRRMTEDLILSSNNSCRFTQPYPIIKSDSSLMSECNTPRWNTTSNNNIDFYSASLQQNNYSPISQQLTPMLSTGSPVSSVDGGYYDSCLDLIICSSSPSMV